MFSLLVTHPAVGDTKHSGVLIVKGWNIRHPRKNSDQLTFSRKSLKIFSLYPPFSESSFAALHLSFSRTGSVSASGSSLTASVATEWECAWSARKWFSQTETDQADHDGFRLGPPFGWKLSAEGEIGVLLFHTWYICFSKLFSHSFLFFFQQLWSFFSQAFDLQFVHGKIFISQIWFSLTQLKVCFFLPMLRSGKNGHYDWLIWHGVSVFSGRLDFF